MNNKISINDVISFCKRNSNVSCTYCPAWDYMGYSRCYFNTFLPMDWDVDEATDIIGECLEDEIDPIGHKDVII